MLRELQGVVDFKAEVADGALKLAVTEQLQKDRTHHY